jgi:hypothetical protein
VAANFGATSAQAVGPRFDPAKRTVAGSCTKPSVEARLLRIVAREGDGERATPTLAVAVLTLVGTALGMASAVPLLHSLDVGIIIGSPTIFVGAVFIAAAGLLTRWYAARTEARELEGAREAVRKARAALQEEVPGEASTKARSDLQESSISLHVAGLKIDIRSLRRRALWAFVPGLLVCLGSLLAPLAAYKLALESKGTWQYFIGGSTLAALILGVGSSLLRHDNKIREQVRAVESELLYFSRLETGLECARSLGAVEYDRGLSVIVQHLLAAPPLLSSLPTTPEPEEAAGGPAAAASKVLTKLAEAVAKKAAGDTGDEPDD